MQILTVKDGKAFAECDDYKNEIASKIREFNPDFISFSFRNL